MTAQAGPEGPELAALVHRLAECPRDFLEEPRIGASGKVVVGAVVFDLIVSLRGPSHVHLPFGGDDPSDRNAMRIVLVACWLLSDAYFRERRDPPGPLPFAFGSVPPESVSVYVMKTPATENPKN